MEQVNFDELAVELTQRMKEGLEDNPMALAFFGSWAKGKAREESDIDLLLITRELPLNPIERGKVGYKPIVDRAGQGRISILARTVEEFNSDVTSLHLDLSQHTVIISDLEGFLETRLKEVRQFIKEAKLVRRRDSLGILYWWWEGLPSKPGWSLTREGFKGCFSEKMLTSG